MATSYEVTFEGGQKLLNVLRHLGDDSGTVMGQAILEEAQVIFAKSQILVPVDTGALRGSGNTSAITQFPEGLGVDIYYGGPSAPYALFVQEILSNKHIAPTQAKYLEKPFMERLPNLARNIAKRVNRITMEAMMK